MKNCFFVSLQILLLLSISSAQNSAVSSYLDANDWVDGGDILMRTIRATKSAPTTYFCALQFNSGGEGGGYTGIQDTPDQRGKYLYIFSLWDPSNHQKITAPFKGPGTQTENFGGEGTGLKSWNFALGWVPNNWYTLLLRRWDQNGHTFFGYWVRDVTGNKWTHMVTFDYPVANVYFNGGTMSFLEDWTSNGAYERRFELKDGFKRTKEGRWYPFSQSRFSFNQGDTQQGGRSFNYRNAYDAGVSNGAYYYQTGGNTRYTCSANCNLNNNPGSQPNNPAIDFQIIKTTAYQILWNVPASSTPQFRFAIKINGNPFYALVDPEARSAPLRARVGDKIELILEDVLGRSTTKTGIAA